MKDKEIIIIDNREFKYNSFYKRLEAIDKKLPEIACSKCNNTLFELKYGIYEINAYCKCGHKITVYDG